MSKTHQYQTTLNWTGNKGKSTLNYKAYERSYAIQIEGKPVLEGSSDPSFRGDRNKYNPEELLVASLSACHMLWYLHLCSVSGILVESYSDHASGIMEESNDGSGFFKEVTLKPVVIISKIENKELASSLHHKANKMCFIANSMNFPVLHEVEIKIKRS